MDSFKEIWNAVLTYCEERVTETAFNLWIKKTEFVSFEAATITLRLPSAMYMDVVISQYGTMFSEAFAAIMGFEVKIKYICAEDNDREEHKFYQDKQHLEDYKNEQYTFENFIVGSSNRFAYVAAKAVASDPGLNLTQNSKMRNYNPLFIYGNSGLGKTHLLKAICYEVKKKFPDMNILYIRAEQFVNEFMQALQYKTTDEFHEKFRNSIDLLLIDDIQFIAGKQQTIEEFFHTFNELHEAKKQNVISSDKHPREIATLEERLRSRFEWGITADIQPPDYETKMAILKKRAELEHLDINQEVMQYVATNINSNIRELEGALNKIYVFANLEKKPVTLELAENALKDTIECQKEVTPQLIMDVVAEHYNISVSDIISKKKNKEIANPRQICMYLSRKYTDYSLQNIGKIMGNRDHTTVIHGHDKIGKMLETDENLKSNLDIIIKKLNPPT